VTRKINLWGVVVICLVAFGVIALLAERVFEHVPHSEDEVAYVFQAKVFAQNRLAVPTPPLAEAFWTPFVVDYERQRFSNKYPIAWSLLLSLGIRLGAPWLINTLLGSLTLGLIAWLGYCFYCDKKAASSCYIPLAAAGLALVTPGFLFLSASLLSHAASLFWATLTLLALYYLTTAGEEALENKFVEQTFSTGPARQSDLDRLESPSHNVAASSIGGGVGQVRDDFQANRSSRPRQALYAFLVGLFLGLTFATRTFAALALGAVTGIFVLSLILRRRLPWTVLAWLVVGGAIPTGLLMLYWWAVTGDPLFNPYALVWPYDRTGFGPEVGPQGYYLADGILINTRLKLEALATGLFGWPGWSNIIFLPIPFLAGRANRWDWLLLGTFLSIMVIYIFYWSFGGLDGGFPRYYYDVLPAFVLLTVRGVQISGQLLSRWRPALSWLPLGVVAIFIAYNLTWNLPPRLAAQKGKYDITPAPLRAVAQAGLTEPALVLVKDYENWSDFAVPFAANSPTLDGPVIYAIDWGPGYTPQVRAHFAGRRCWELAGESLRPCPPEEKAGLAE
jgi:4-amino-4-deoxy-L-arabinose transferase-like glycosyltransferase